MNEPQTSYRLNLTMAIIPVSTDGRIDYSNQGLQIKDELNLTAASFMEIAGVLNRFHELAEKIKELQAVKAEGRDRFEG